MGKKTEEKSKKKQQKSPDNAHRYWLLYLQFGLWSYNIQKPKQNRNDKISMHMTAYRETKLFVFLFLLLFNFYYSKNSADIRTLLCFASHSGSENGTRKSKSSKTTQNTPTQTLIGKLCKIRTSTEYTTESHRKEGKKTKIFDTQRFREAHAPEMRWWWFMVVVYLLLILIILEKKEEKKWFSFVFIELF